MTETEAEALLADKSIFFRCVEGSNDTVMLTDHRGMLFYVNPAWQKLYGYTQDEIIGKTPAILRSRHQDNVFYKKMWNDIANPSMGYWKGELINATKTGQEIPIFLTITPFVDDSRELRGYMGIGVDISEKKRLEAQVLHQDRLASIGTVASGLAHEIGNPMGVIRGRAEYLISLATGNEKLTSGLKTIVEQIDRISKLIYSLLHLAREGKSDQEAAGPVKVTPLLENILGLLGASLRKNQISVTTEIPDTVIVRAEPIRLEQVLFNMSLNAIHAIEKARKDGRGGPHSLRFSAQKKGQHWHLAIADSGTGISKENLQNIFKPFFTTKEVGVGTGLGLALASQIVHSWHGQILVDTVFGSGSTFTVVLPQEGAKFGDVALSPRP